MTKHVILVTGPSGVGKGTVLKTLKERIGSTNLNRWHESVSCTTRTPRIGEAHGKSYYFLTKKEFIQKVDNGEFLEYEEFVGHFYGTLKSELLRCPDGSCVVVEIDLKGAEKIIDMDISKSGELTVIPFFISPPSTEELRRRLVARGSENEEVVTRRLARAEEDNRIFLSSGLDGLFFNVENIDPICCAEAMMKQLLRKGILN